MKSGETEEEILARQFILIGSGTRRNLTRQVISPVSPLFWGQGERSAVLGRDLDFELGLAFDLAFRF